MSWARPIKRILLEKRLMLGIVGMTLLVDVGLYTFAVYPWTFRVATARERADAASQRLAVSQETLSVARGTMAAKDRVEADLLEFYDGVLPQDLASARGLTYARLSVLARQSNLQLERRGTTFEADEDRTLGRLRTTMLLAGDYRDIRRFLYELETSPEFIVIEEVVLSQGNEVGSTLALALGVSTYYRSRSTI